MIKTSNRIWEGILLGIKINRIHLEIDYVCRYAGVGEIMTSLNISDAPFGITSVDRIPVHRDSCSLLLPLSIFDRKFHAEIERNSGGDQ